jgi:hypothetical protein
MVTIAAAGQAVVPGPRSDVEHLPIAACHQDLLQVGDGSSERNLVNNDDLSWYKPSFCLEMADPNSRSQPATHPGGCYKSARLSHCGMTNADICRLCFC